MSGKSLGLTSKGQNTQQRIVAAGDRLIGRHGVTRVTFNDVRAEANVSSSQIYRYLVDKQSLLCPVIDHHDIRPSARRRRWDIHPNSPDTPTRYWQARCIAAPKPQQITTSHRGATT